MVLETILYILQLSFPSIYRIQLGAKLHYVLVKAFANGGINFSISNTLTVEWDMLSFPLCC
jgi:hypothetical protein